MMQHQLMLHSAASVQCMSILTTHKTRRQEQKKVRKQQVLHFDKSIIKHYATLCGSFAISSFLKSL